MYDIEKDLEMPKSLGQKGRPRIYPWDKMSVGDSFFVADQNDKGKVAVAASIYGKKHGLRLSLKNEGDGFRVWRIE